MLFAVNTDMCGKSTLRLERSCFTMHLVFSLEGFLQGQPDLRRSGRIFSGGVVALSLLLLLPILWAPRTPPGFHGISDFYGDWLGSGVSSMRRLVRLGYATLF
jgi:hypothetical protein